MSDGKGAAYLADIAPGGMGLIAGAEAMSARLLAGILMLGVVVGLGLLSAVRADERVQTGEASVLLTRR
jgi:hypothetical protein